MRGITVALFVITAGAAHAQGSIQKCVGADGKIHYQDTPCDAQHKAAGEIKRDTTKASKEALIRAEQDKVKVKLLQLDREREALAHHIQREKAIQAQAAAEERAASEARADARTRALIDALNQPTSYVPSSGYSSYSPSRPAEAPAPRPAAPAPTYGGPAAQAPKR